MAANLAQIQWTWTGWGGAPGYTSFYMSSIDPTALSSANDSIKTFIEAIRAFLPTGISVAPPSTFRLLDGNTGDLEGFVADPTPPTSSLGSGSGSFAAPAGFSVNWLTDGHGPSRAVVGRSYFVPASQAAYQTDGTLVDATRTTINTAANALAAALSPIFVVWKRPVSGGGGFVNAVTAARCNDRVSILRSRRQ